MKPPSAIDDLLDPRPSPPAAKTAGKDEKLNDRKTEKLSTRKTASLPSGTATPESPSVSAAKSKCTYYIPTDLAERIDLAHAQSRIYTRSSHYKASKSEFIEAAVSYALNEFDAHGKQSEVVRMLAELLSKRAPSSD